VTSFVDTRLDDGLVVYDTAGGPAYQTDIVITASGRESRNARWAAARGRWQLGERRLTRAEAETLLAFFRARQGRLVGFRWKDWADYQVATGYGRIGSGVGDGTPSHLLYKRYSSGGVDVYRPIAKPVWAGVTAKVAGATKTVTASVVDGEPDRLVFAATTTRQVTDISRADPCVVTAAGHGISAGTLVYLDAVNGMSEVNGNAYTVDSATTDTLTLDLDSSAFAAYVSGGTVAVYPQPADALTWTGEFDVPARFDADAFACRFEAHDAASGQALFWLDSLPVVELKLA
jgi:uncharacterized protein (TIGR02217 family)